MMKPCLSGADGFHGGMLKCPFLHNIAQTHGPEYASSLALSPSSPNGSDTRRPLLAEEYDGGDFSSTFALFHGRGGFLPLPHLSAQESKVIYPVEQSGAKVELTRAQCPYSSGAPTGNQTSFVPLPLVAAPLASMSMSWGSDWFNIHHLFQKHLGQHRAQHRKPPKQPQQPSGHPQRGSVGPGLGGPGAAHVQSADTGGGGKCPLRRALGPLAGVVFNKHGHLSCPEPIIKMRAVLAATRPVRELRPQALPIKLLAVAMTTVALNVPCGMWREHTEKFSTQWFMAVHATIPFIAMIRKAVIMPKYAILFTICAAIAGQYIGARLERKRLMTQAKDELGGLVMATPVETSTRRGTERALPQQHVALPLASLLMSAQILEESSVVAASRGSTQWNLLPRGDDGWQHGSAAEDAVPLAVTADVPRGNVPGNSDHLLRQQRNLQFRVTKMGSDGTARVKRSGLMKTDCSDARMLVGHSARTPTLGAGIVAC